MKKLFGFFGFVVIVTLFLSVYSGSIFAQEIQLGPDPLDKNLGDVSTEYSEDSSFTTTIISPPDYKDPDRLESIDDAVKKVKIVFPGVDASKVQVCLRGDYCLKDSIIENVGLFAVGTLVGGGFNPIGGYLAQKFIDLPADNVVGSKLTKLDADGSITVCGAGESNLKQECTPEDKVWFWAGKNYYITAYERQGENWVVRSQAGFFVNHHEPIVKITPLNNKSPEKFRVELHQDRLSKDGKQKANNFQIVMQGTGGYMQERCLPQDDSKNKNFRLTSPSDQYVVEFPYKDSEDDGKGVIAGRYVIKVNEQVNEDKPVGDDCSGGYTFLKYECSVFDKKATPECKEIIDPGGSDTKKLQNLLDEIGAAKGSIIPCEEGKPNPGVLKCNELDTAIGKIPLNPVGFITKLFQIVLSFAAIGAMLLILYAGYRLLLSRGDKEVIQAQRERITSAIVGLLFIIFSLVLLSVIAGDVLKIPGFNDNPLPGQKSNQTNTK